MTDQMVRADYDAETGISTVTLNTKYGVFTETAKLHEEDKDIANRWDGIYFAYMKCLIAKLRGKARMYERRAEGVKYASDVMRNQQRDYPDYDFGDAFLSLCCVRDNLLNDALNCRKTANEREARYKEMVDEHLTKRRSLRKFVDEKERTKEE